MNDMNTPDQEGTQSQTPTNNSTSQQIDIPNFNTIYWLGICSLIGLFCCGCANIICAIIALIMASQATKLYNENPEKYTESSFKKIKTGKTCSIIGIVLGVLFTIVYFIINVASAAYDPYYY